MWRRYKSVGVFSAVLGQKLLSGREEWACHAWADMDSSRPRGGGI